MADLVLGLDTSTAAAVAVADGPQVLGAARATEIMAHAEQLMPLVRQVCAEAGIGLAAAGRVVVGLGPGPFTGLRVGIVTAQVLAAALGLPWRGVCSLDVIAVQHAAGRPSGEFVVATDARRREVYWARYGPDGRRLEGPAVGPPDAVPRLPTVGPAADLYPDRLRAADGPRSLEPGVLATAGPTLPDAGREPLYLRRPDAAEPTRRKPVLLRRRGPR